MKFVDAYCDLAGMSDVDPDDARTCFYAHDGSTCTLIRVRGAQSHLSPDEASEAMMLALQDIGANLRERGHGMTITFEQSANISEDVERLMEPLHDARGPFYGPDTGRDATAAGRTTRRRTHPDRSLDIPRCCRSGTDA